MEIWEINSDWTTKKIFKNKSEADKYIKENNPNNIFQILYRESIDKPVFLYYNGTKQWN